MTSTTYNPLPSAIVFFEVRVPQSYWGNALDSDEKVIEAVGRYLYGDFTVFAVAQPEEFDGPWRVTVQYDHYGDDEPAFRVTYQRDRLMSGGIGSTLLSMFRPVS